MEKLKPYNLGQTGKKEAIPYLIKYLKNGSINQRKIAASAVKKLLKIFHEETELVVPCLLENLSHKDERLREYILKIIVDLPLTLSGDAKDILNDIYMNDGCQRNNDLAKEILEREYQSESPEIISKQETDTIKFSLPAIRNSTTKELQLKSMFRRKILDGSIKNKHQLIEMIKELGLTINRDGQNYLGLRLPGKNHSFRIQHHFDKIDSAPRRGNALQQATINSNELLRSKKQDHLISIPALAKKIGIGSSFLYKQFEEHDLIIRDDNNNWRLTDSGKKMGGDYKKPPKGNTKFVAWPITLAEPNVLKEFWEIFLDKKRSWINDFSDSDFEKKSNSFISTTALAKKLQLQTRILFKYLENAGWIYKSNNRHWRLTKSGKENGGRYRKSSNGDGKYVVWPANLSTSEKLNGLWNIVEKENDSSLNVLHNNESEDLISTSVLASKIGIQNKILFDIFNEKGLIYRDEKRQWRLTESGKSLGAGYKQTPKGYAKFIVWPVGFSESNILARLMETKKDEKIVPPILNPERLVEYMQNIYQNSALLQADVNESHEEKYFALTSEQALILNTALPHGKTIKVVAFAGTGKTTTICEYAKKYRKTRFLYLAYNKSVQVEATKKFPSNVTCRTAHSIAYRQLGYKFKNKLVGNLKAFDINRLFQLDSYRDGAILIKILNNFINSTDKNIYLKHFPKKEFGYINDSERKKLIDLAGDSWEMMIDENTIKFPMLHDGYLKLYQRLEPELDFDCILVDEAHDLNPVIFDIVNRQECAKIYIGDSHQQIYAFRGAVDAMDKIEPDYLFYLTNSFRFNPQIGQIATSILRIFKQEKKQITGLNRSHCKTSKQTIITRTNAMAFAEAVKFINKTSLGFVGGSGKYRFRDILNVYWLYDDQLEMIKDPFYKNFITYKDFKHYSIESQEIESLAVINVVEEFNHEIPAYLDAIYKAEVYEGDADVIFSTAHKSKGLEWDRVILSNDFKNLCRLRLDAKSQNESIEAFIDRINLDLPDHADEYFKFDLPWRWEINELNLIYVAATRAKSELRLNTDLNIFCELVKKSGFE